MPGDLHTHSNFSDGSSDIETLPELAARAGLSHLAVSDHDTGLGIRWAGAHPVQAGVQLIPAVELTCRDTARGRRVHLLCYCPALTPELDAFFDLMAQRRNEAAERGMRALAQMYPQFSAARARALSARAGVIFKTSLIRVLYEDGYTDGIYRELYRELFTGPEHKIEYTTLYEPLEKVLRIARATGGVVVLAHPSVYKSMELAAELAQAGAIDGIEINHPRNTPQDRAVLSELALRNGLLVTGGSDFHGMHMSHPVPLGTCVTSDDAIARILALAGQRRGAQHA